MSTDQPQSNAGQFPEQKVTKLEPLPNTKNYPICPHCGCNTLVMFAPPKKEVFDDLDKRYKLWGTTEYVDWDRAHLYCCNGETDCKFETKIKDLVTPMREARYKLTD